MREIKFRAWDKENKVMGIFPDENGRVEIKDFKNYKNYYPFGYVLKTEIYIAMQYTGLKDCKGKEIYEGDIVKCENGSIGVVKYNKDKLKYLFSTKENSMWKNPIEGFRKPLEVIGNIHENPELLKE